MIALLECGHEPRNLMPGDGGSMYCGMCAAGVPRCPSLECAARGCDCMIEPLGPSRSEVAGTFMDAITRAVRARRFRYTNEADLHQLLVDVLVDAELSVEREVWLDADNRIDLLVNGMIGVEVKVDGTAGAVRRQLARYARQERIRGLVLVTTRSRHLMPAAIDGCIVRTVVVNGGVW